ncbi:TPA: hypothetical protein ACGO8I_002045 [Streptococcus suis]
MSKQAKLSQERNEKSFEKVLTKQIEDDRMNELSNLRQVTTKKENKKSFKKMLTRS